MPLWKKLLLTGTTLVALIAVVGFFVASWDRAKFNYRLASLLSRHHVFDAPTFEHPYGVWLALK